MADGQINLSILRAEVAKSRVIDIEATRIVERKFRQAKQEMLREFDDDKVTEELKGGEEAENLSGTLANYKSAEGENGNLFSFIGFLSGDDPAGALRDFIEDNTRLNTIPVLNSQDSKLNFRFLGYVPSAADIRRVTQVPEGWDQGYALSWVTLIEEGVGTFFNHYIYKLYAVNTRSTRGVQIKGTARSGDLIPIKYTTKILNDFVNTIGTSGPQ